MWFFLYSFDVPFLFIYIYIIYNWILFFFLGFLGSLNCLFFSFCLFYFCICCFARHYVHSTILFSWTQNIFIYKDFIYIYIVCIMKLLYFFFSLFLVLLFLIVFNASSLEQVYAIFILNLPAYNHKEILGLDAYLFSLGFKFLISSEEKATWKEILFFFKNFYACKI